jgi:hypothetical protein
MPTQQELDVARASLRGEVVASGVNEENGNPALEAGATAEAAAGVTAGDAAHGGAS